MEGVGVSTVDAAVRTSPGPSVHVAELGGSPGPSRRAGLAGQLCAGEVLRRQEGAGEDTNLHEAPCVSHRWLGWTVCLPL